MSEPDSLLSDEEAQALILSCCRARPKRGAAEDEIVKVIEWAERVKLDTLTLEMVLDGKMDVRWKRGEIHFVKRWEDSDDER